MKILVEEDIWGFDLCTALEEISSQRRDQALKFKYEEGRRLCVLAYRLLKQALRDEFGFEGNPLFEYNAHGKPSIVGHPEFHFNLSHCKEAVVCVVSHQPVGIDVEVIREHKEDLVRYTMNDDEVRQVEAAIFPATAFIRLWTMKEATLKLDGKGIIDDLKHVIDPERIHYTTIERPKYVYTIAEYRFDC